MTTSAEIKEMALVCGADLSGIAPVERFENAPNGFHPFNIYKNTKSVIVIAVREPKSPLLSKSAVPYTFASDIALQKVFMATFNMVCKLEDRGIEAIPIPTEPYEYWDAENMTGKGILSLKHAGYLAGLGVIGRNSLLINKKYGNLIRLSAILINAAVKGDALENMQLNCETCNLCVNNCPAQAISDGFVNQSKCRPQSHYHNAKGYFLNTCNNCRKACPHLSGFNDYNSNTIFKLRSVIKVKNFC